MRKKPTWPKPAESAFTLTELVLVIALLGTVTAIATLRLGGAAERLRQRAAEADLSVLREGFTGTASVPGYLADMETLPGFSPAYLRVHCLLSPTNVLGRAGVLLDDGATREGYAAFACFTNWNPETGRGWRGPYVRVSARTQNAEPSRAGLFPAAADRRASGDASFAARGFYPLGLPLFGTAGEQAVSDPWGNPYVLHIPPPEAFSTPNDARRFRFARLVSAGPDGVLQTPCHCASPLTEEARRRLRLAGRLPDGSVAARGDDLVLFLNRPDLFQSDE